MIGQIEWHVERSIAPAFIPSGIMATMRDYRHLDGTKFRVWQPLSDELIEDIVDGGSPVGLAVLEMIWRSFRFYLDRRFDDRFAFWSWAPMVERWKT